jgi:hypothetical protein
MLGINEADNSKDAVLTLHIRKAITGVKNYMNADVDAERLYPDAVMELTLYFYRNAGTENMSYYMQGQRTVMTNKYEALPDFIKNLLPQPYVKLMG